MEKENLIALTKKISNGTATDEEIAQYSQWCDHQQAPVWNEKLMGHQPTTEKALFHRIHTTITATRGKRVGFPLNPDSYREGGQPVRRSFSKGGGVVIRYAIAASVALLATAGIWIYTQTPSTQHSAVSAQILPGTNKATLSLANGTTLNLSEQQQGIIIKQDQIAYNDGTPIEPKALKHPNTSTPLPIAIGNLNTIKTPNGGQYQLTLPDGTKAFLNAASTISFPTTFSETVRHITVTGEAYFDVVQDPIRPFVITTGDLTTTVLGTAFNVKAYENEAIAITVATGKVKVERSETNLEILTANQQTIYNVTTDQLKTTQVNATDLTAWTQGLFRFSNTTIQEIMPQLARWYDIDIYYEGTPTKEAFTGFISRNVNLSTVLKMLEETGGVKFEVKDKTVMVK